VLIGAFVFDKILGLLVVVVPVALGLIVILVPAKREDPKRHILWRFALGACLIAYGGLTWWQQSRATRIANRERESAIEETSASVSANVTKTVTQQYSQMIADQKQEIADLKKQLSAQGKDVAVIRNSNIVTGKAPVKVEVTNPPPGGQEHPPELHGFSHEASPNPQYGNRAIEFILTTNKVMNGTKGMLQCSKGKINRGTARVLGADVMIGGGGISDDRTFTVNLSSPNWSPDSALSITLYFDDDLGTCKFSPFN